MLNFSGVNREGVWDIYRTCSAPTSGEIHRHFFQEGHEGLFTCTVFRCRPSKTAKVACLGISG